MYLDATTLVLAGGFVTSLSGAFLLSYWWQDRRAWTAFWWGLANGGVGAGIILLALHSNLPFYISHIIVPLFLDLCAASAFVAARIFNRGRINPCRVALSVAAWIATLAVAGGIVREQFVAALGVGTTGAVYAAAALEFWLGRGEKLRGRKPIIGVIAAYSISLLLLSLQHASSIAFNPVPPTNWLGIINIVGLAYALSVTLLLITMLKGRDEEKYKIAALTDPLTGLANRRAFMEWPQLVCDRGGHDEQHVALLAFDLDGFKRINDTFGHATGDQVLRTFADVLVTTLRPTSPAARIGGEEFAVVVPGVDGAVAVAIATRICTAFQRAAHFVDGQKIEATVSAGVATTGGQVHEVADLLASADAALYRAKRAGRNRVILAGGNPVGLAIGNVVQIS
jgi:diguanylate cyclase (GGDEF)-like protein